MRSAKDLGLLFKIKRWISDKPPTCYYLVTPMNLDYVLILFLTRNMDTSLFDKRSGSRGAPVAALASNRRNFWYFSDVLTPFLRSRI